MSEYQFRTFEVSDLERLKEITVGAFDGVSIDRNIENQFGTINGRDWRWRKARHIEWDAERDGKGIFVADFNGEIVGYITTFADHEAGIGIIPNLAVDTQHRGRGLGQKLIQFALDHFRHIGLTHAKIETLEQNPIGKQLYPKMGFQEVARQIHYVREL